MFIALQNPSKDDNEFGISNGRSLSIGGSLLVEEFCGGEVIRRGRFPSQNAWSLHYP